jgi:hypothetical protein
VTRLAAWLLVRLSTLLAQVVIPDPGDDIWDDHATACRRCRHPHADHQPECTAWQATIPGLPDAEPCQCGGWVG